MSVLPPRLQHLKVPSLDAVDFLLDMVAGEKPTRLKRRTATPTRVQTSFEVRGEHNAADVYLPGSGLPRAGILLVPGVARLGKDDPRLISFANTVARSGFAVLVPDIETLKDLNVRPWTRDIVAQGFQHLCQHPEWTPGGRAGIGGMSFAMGPGVMAAVEPAIRDDVRFLFCVGGYHDITAQNRFALTGWYRERGGPAGDGPWRHRAPDDYTRWVMCLSMLGDIPDQASRAAIREVADARVEYKEASLDAVRHRVTDPAGEALMAFIENTDREKFDGLYAALPDRMRRDMEGMDPSRLDLSQLRARLILVHGLGDDIIPYVESLGLHRAAPKGQSRFYRVQGLNHVTMAKPGPLDAWQMLSAVTHLLQERASV